MEQDRGGVNDLHKGSKEFDGTSPVNIVEQRGGKKETDYGKEYWG